MDTQTQNIPSIFPAAKEQVVLFRVAIATSVWMGANEWMLIQYVVLSALSGELTRKALYKCSQFTQNVGQAPYCNHSDYCYFTLRITFNPSCAQNVA